MPISKNLQYLRKREGVTQEELAEQMQVSRQAVSKWETGEAYPDTDKLIALCDRFGVSMDDFVRGDLTANKSHTVPDEILTSEPDAQDGVNADNARAHIKRFACRISLGVFLVLLGVAVCVAMCAVATVYGQGNTANIISAMSGVAVVVFVAVAVFLFVLAGISHNNYARINGLACPFEKTELENLNKNFALVTACSVSNLILDVAALIVA
ncbi:MAG: helix-turn-helix domain-containing protein, partial [Candidatus Coproplasma sp.]